MASQFMDSRIYGGAWGTPELRAIFDEEARVRAGWKSLAVLAETEGEFGLIPRGHGRTRRRKLPRDRAGRDFSRRGAPGF